MSQTSSRSLLIVRVNKKNIPPEEQTPLRFDAFAFYNTQIDSISVHQMQSLKPSDYREAVSKFLHRQYQYSFVSAIEEFRSVIDNIFICKFPDKNIKISAFNKFKKIDNNIFIENNARVKIKFSDIVSVFFRLRHKIVHNAGVITDIDEFVNTVRKETGNSSKELCSFIENFFIEYNDEAIITFLDKKSHGMYLKSKCTTIMSRILHTIINATYQLFKSYNVDIPLTQKIKSQ